jgi:hypothetical protein
MAQITQTGLVNSAVAGAKDLPGLVTNLQAIDPALAQQITGKALIASKSVYGVVISTGLTWAVTKYGLGWDANTVDAVSGVVVLVATAAFRALSTTPITSWFVSKKTAPVSTTPTTT